jgi:two-component system, cell cycle sensor histidine kinase and response regulator CckA
LRRFGYHVLTASDGADALAVLATGEYRPDLVFSDVVMPRVSGPELLARLRAAGDAPKVLFASGYTSRDATGEVQVEPGIRVLTKPWTVPELLEAVRESLDA